MIVMKHATLIGSLSGSVEHYWRGLEFMRHNLGRFTWDDMISNHYALDDINDAMRNMHSLEHVIDQLLHRRVEAMHLFGLLPQYRVFRRNNFVNCHTIFFHQVNTIKSRPYKIPLFIIDYIVSYMA